METMTSENIYRIEITETNLPAKVLKTSFKELKLRPLRHHNLFSLSTIKERT